MIQLDVKYSYQNKWTSKRINLDKYKFKYKYKNNFDINKKLRQKIKV